MVNSEITSLQNISIDHIGLEDEYTHTIKHTVHEETSSRLLDIRLTWLNMATCWLYNSITRKALLFPLITENYLSEAKSCIKLN